MVPPLFGFPDINHAVQAIHDSWTDIKGVGWFKFNNSIYSAPSPTFIQDLSLTFKMSDINATRLPSSVFIGLISNGAYVGDDVYFTLIRGDK